jgi:hypothetical protein
MVLMSVHQDQAPPPIAVHVASPEIIGDQELQELGFACPASAPMAQI